MQCHATDLLQYLVDEKITPDVLSDQTAAHDPLNGHQGARLSAQAGATPIDGRQALLVSNNPYGMGDIAGLGSPTSELLASWIWGRLEPELPGLSWVTVHETASCGAHFDGARYRIWKEFPLDSALRLARAPQGDARRRIHGRSLALRLHLEAPLDELLGWTVDFGDVKALFAPVFARLDHRPLYELPEVGDNDLASLLAWVRRACAGALPALERIDLYESPGCGALLAWGARPPALPV